MKLWYDQIDKFSYRDQPSFSYTLWKYPIDVSFVNFRKTYNLFINTGKKTTTFSCG